MAIPIITVNVSIRIVKVILLNPFLDGGSAFFLAEIEQATLHVPESSIDLYKLATPWKNFKNIVAISEDDTAIETSVSIPVMIQEYYSMNGQKFGEPKKGINIIRMADGSYKKVIFK